MDNKLIAAKQRQRLFYCLLLLVLGLGIRPHRLLAQAAAGGSGAVNGVVRNDQGDPMFGVTVVATNLKTHLAAGTPTDSMGVFRFYKLPVGEKYSFSFSSVGFLPQTLSGYNIK